jgi:hypothetical protein
MRSNPNHSDDPYRGGREVEYILSLKQAYANAEVHRYTAEVLSCHEFTYFLNGLALTFKNSKLLLSLLTPCIISMVRDCHKKGMAVDRAQSYVARRLEQAVEIDDLIYLGIRRIPREAG